VFTCTEHVRTAWNARRRRSCVRPVRRTEARTTEPLLTMALCGAGCLESSGDMNAGMNTVACGGFLTVGCCPAQRPHALSDSVISGAAANDLSHPIRRTAVAHRASARLVSTAYPRPTGRHACPTAGLHCALPRSLPACQVVRHFSLDSVHMCGAGRPRTRGDALYHFRFWILDCGLPRWAA